MPKNESIPDYKRVEIFKDIKAGYSCRALAKAHGVSKTVANRLQQEYKTLHGIEKKPITKAEGKRRAKISKAAVTIQAVKKAEYISEGFINAFEVISYNANHLIEVINHSKIEADKLKANQEEILEKFEQYIDETDGDKQKKGKIALMFLIGESIKKIDDFFMRDSIRIKAVGELRKHLETFLKLKQEIIDIQTIKKMLDAFFNGCEELDDTNYIRFRERVVKDAPILSRLFTAFEQKGAEDGSDSDQQE